jgi:hypothetical protein
MTIPLSDAASTSPLTVLRTLSAVELQPHRWTTLRWAQTFAGGYEGLDPSRPTEWRIPLAGEYEATLPLASTSQESYTLSFETFLDRKYLADAVYVPGASAVPFRTTFHAAAGQSFELAACHTSLSPVELRGVRAGGCLEVEIRRVGPEG